MKYNILKKFPVLENTLSESTLFGLIVDNILNTFFKSLADDISVLCFLIGAEIFSNAVFKRFLTLNSEYSFPEDSLSDSLDEPESPLISSFSSREMFSLIISNLSKIPTIAGLIFNKLDFPIILSPFSNK
ncbi:hypothetical protein AYI69_g3436 [Smittium culicis]|uniref:Uncharacterized protein n=1 Tax=Smittium culicis TaxID=133412 RepID=A0A1R1YJP3_9FUNG|nr:hypothetical protein AYI69_g3436 [Smittium culicis]